MSPKWKLFGIANYVLLLLYLFLFIMAIRFMLAAGIEGSGQLVFFLIVVSMLFIILNCILNAFIFHRHLPDKPVTPLIEKIHQVSTVLYILSLMVVFFFFFGSAWDGLKSEDSESPLYLILLTLFITLTFGLLTLFCQFNVMKTIKKTMTIQYPVK